MATAKKLPSGSWRVLVFDGYDENKKRKYTSITASTKKEAEFAAAERALNGERNPTSDMTVGEAIDRYIASRDKVLSPPIVAAYISNRRNNLQGLPSSRTRARGRAYSYPTAP